MKDVKRWHMRGFTSLLTVVGFLVMSITGLVLYIVPQGRVAYWVEWKLLLLTKGQWGDIHILSSLLFVGAGVAHIYFNWKVLVGYVLKKGKGGIKLKRELAVAFIIGIVLVVGGIKPFPPVSYLLDFNNYIKDAWISEPDYDPPFGHAEELSLKVFCKKTGIPLNMAISELKGMELKEVEPGNRLVDIARANKLSSLDLYRMIKKYEPPEEPAPLGPWTSQMIEERMAGTGFGGKSLAEGTKGLGEEPAVLVERLKSKGFKIDSLDRSIRQLAQDNDLSPLEFMKAALIK
jgi:Domain of unknown function (DUF4405)